MTCFFKQQKTTKLYQILRIDMQGSNKSFLLNATTLSGCSACAHPLPQCAVCLQRMRVHLSPAADAAAPAPPAALNRSQSLYNPSRLGPPAPNTSASRLAFDLKASALVSPPANTAKPPLHLSASMFLHNSNNSHPDLVSQVFSSFYAIFMQIILMHPSILVT
jgi:hypothetical protein